MLKPEDPKPVIAEAPVEAEAPSAAVEAEEVTEEGKDEE